MEQVCSLYLTFKQCLNPIEGGFMPKPEDKNQNPNKNPNQNQNEQERQRKMKEEQTKRPGQSTDQPRGPQGPAKR
jgi:hypothetical protein